MSPSLHQSWPLTSTRWADALFATIVLTFTAWAASVWWMSAMVPGQDYPQFLVFVRAVEDMGNSSSPFHGTYETAPWFTPTSLPIHLGSVLAGLPGGSIEAAGRLLLTGQTVGLVVASLFLLRTLERSRWAIVLLFPLIHSAWTVVGGFVAFATALPLVVLGWALTVRWLRRLDARSGVALAVTLSATLFWHGIAYAQLGLGFATLWILWRAPSMRARALAIVPAVPSLMHCAIWMISQFGGAADRGHTSWQTPSAAARALIDVVWSSVPDAATRAIALVVLVSVGFVLDWRPKNATPVAPSVWRGEHPFAIVAVVYLAAYFVLPMYMNRVEGFSNRFAYLACLAFVFGWEVPRAPIVRSLTMCAILAFSAWCIGDLARRFRAFDVETKGASVLISHLGDGDTLYYWPARRGYAKAFEAKGNKAMIELEQFATIRHGGLPNSSLAGYGFNYVRYVDNRNPMPGLSGSPKYGPKLTRFDYVLMHGEEAQMDEHFRLVERFEGWALYGVCGSHLFPTC